jgi:hypothetical protein
VTINLPAMAGAYYVSGDGSEASAYGARDAAFRTAVKTTYVAG